MPGVDKFVFVGDQKQLSSFTQVSNLSLSLFERVLLNGTYQKPHMLDTQYRMHPSISAFSRHKFYNDLLKDGITAEQRTMNSIDRPVMFWDTQGKCSEERVRIRTREDNGYTYSNPGEISYIVDILQNLIYDKQVDKSTIGIITPYRGQRDLISKVLSENELINPTKEEIKVDVDRDDIYNDSKPVTIHTVSGIMIASIDAFQGREKDFIIFSCVRSNDTRKIGFLNDERRLNVAITRARYGLFLIGDHQTLDQDPLWHQYLDHLGSREFINRTDSVALSR
ncbi:P-loop containing nucleoside triphosphate hydrolase protein [Yamadazyma tenuis ATCC 10573]|uniref:p-loop containing nucleoside triphosphate hydrolase protein n=2 Tax=Candida tenuis TaxID=2315449 RepID=G3AZG7_CANTC|nr:P-loop containing nucleoside triphosphate hydrolase protein [Yamadazyma tenuis ATCC 10573]EGV66090.1 P-loop containing nucleoside triphosphate hydrolase protein [Yamadazyma tenuis ATCC 10573]